MVSGSSGDSRPATWLAFLLNIVAGTTLMGLMIITCIDVVGRYILNKPLTGSTELIELGLSIVVFAALPVISWRSENIVVDILDKYFSAWAHMVKNTVINLVSAGALYFIGERLLVLGARSLEYEEVSEFWHIPTGWGINFMGIMCWFTAVAMVTLGILHIRATYRRTQQS